MEYSSSYYEQKYLKYKRKYAELQRSKLQRGGASNYDHINVNELYSRVGATSNSLGEGTMKVFTDTGNKSTYGEMTREGMKKMLEGINTQNKVYYDLGSGMGKTIMFSVLDHGFKKSTGVELAPERLQNSKKVKEQLPNELKSKVTLINGSFLNNSINTSDADVIWISSLCFPEPIMNRLSQKLSMEVKDGVHIFTSKKLNAPRLQLHETKPVKMTWDPNSTVYHYISRPEEKLNY